MRFGRFIFVSLILIFFIFSPSRVFAFSGSGSGTSGSPYQITTCVQLQEIEDDLDAHYLLMNDVNCNGFSFEPMGDITTNLFTGTLDGGGHKITNLVIDPIIDLSYVGIFQKMGSGGLITNIGIESGSITSWEGGVAVGSFTAQASGGTISNSYSKATLDGSASNFISADMGGLVGVGQNIEISNSYYSGNIINGSVNPQSTGGLVGDLSAGSVTNSYTTGSLYSGSKIGGIAGQLLSSSTISNSFSTMTRTITGFSASWGLVGEITSGSISNGYYHDPDDSFFAACYAGGNTGCTKIVKNIPYFYTITNAPMSSWDFEDTWSDEKNGTDYPVLYWESHDITSETPTSTPNPTSAPKNLASSSSSSNPNPSVTCSTIPSGTPDLFQINTYKDSAVLYFSPVGDAQNYLISYGFNSNADQFNVFTNRGSSTGVIAYTVNALPADTRIYFKVFAQNNCGHGNWSNTMQVLTNGQVFYRNLISKILSIFPKQTTTLGATTVSGVACETYTVQSGDSLWGIANKKLGNGSQYKKIMDKNKLKSISLYIGQTIQIGC